MPSRIRKGDMVRVTAGREKGKSGEVIQVIREENRVLVRNVNKIKRHTRPTQKNPQGGIVEKEAPLHISNIMLIDPQDERPTRVGFKLVDGNYVRISRRTGAELPDRESSAT